MWTRKELKERAKVAFKANYWKCVLVAFILALLVGSGAGSSVRRNKTTDMTTEQQQAMALLAEDDNLGRLVAFAHGSWHVGTYGVADGNKGKEDGLLVSFLLTGEGQGAHGLLLPGLQLGASTTSGTS